MLNPSFVPSRPLPRAHAPPRRPRVTCRAGPGRISRRALMTGLLSLPLGARASTLLWKSHGTSTVFSVIPTTLSSVNLQPVDIEDTITDLATCDAVFLGEHHNSLVDHALQARIIESLHSTTTRPLAVGLEMVQHKFQPVLDAYLAGDASELDVYLQTEWETRWIWPYELYLPVLRVCKKRNIPLVALSMDFETLTKIKSDGVTALTQDDFHTHIGNPRLFASIVKEAGFKAYVNECVTPSYASHVRMGLINQTTANFNSFYTSRLFRDEAMATRAVRTIQEKGGVIVCVIGGDHVKFEYGVAGRVTRQLQALRKKEIDDLATVTSAKGTRKAGGFFPEPKIRSVMLNPVPTDAYDARDGSLKLEMPVGDIPIPIADYLWFSSVADAKPRRRVKQRWGLPPVERLTSM